MSALLAVLFTVIATVGLIGVLGLMPLIDRWIGAAARKREQLGDEVVELLGVRVPPRALGAATPRYPVVVQRRACDGRPHAVGEACATSPTASAAVDEPSTSSTAAQDRVHLLPPRVHRLQVGATAGLVTLPAAAPTARGTSC